ncbi:MAG: T9SS type A sorting domain-containing protein [Chitinophagaceae bacterium]|nr:MAG: T9SS type A sorting domain-containing protein [Chitinophagaceae bacterium]
MKSFLQLPSWRLLLSSIIFSFLHFTSNAQCVLPSFPAPASIVAAVPEASQYNLVYALPIPSANQAWATQADVPYSVNNTAALASRPFARVAYFMKLESIYTGVQWVWVSMDAFTTDVTRIGIPVGDIAYQQNVSNMNVVNHLGNNRTGVAGNLEFWADAYETANSNNVPNASGSTYDFGDQRLAGDVKFGSFQVHDFNAGETLFGYNAWATSSYNYDDLGIGNCNFCTYPDYTFAANTQYYDVKELYVFVSVPPYEPSCNNATLQLNPNGNATLSVADVTSATVGQCGIQNISLSKTSFTCENVGNNAVTVNFTVDGFQTSCVANVTVVDNIAPTLQVSGTTLTLECDPTPAAIEAALGTATVLDNCANATLQVTTSAVTAVGNTRRQLRTFTGKDASNNTVTEIRSVTWTTNCVVDVPNIYPSDVLCSEYNDGAEPLLNVCYKADKRKVKKVSPRNFYYYSTVVAPVNIGWFGIFTVDVVQTKNCAGFNLYEIQGNQVRAYDQNCRLVANGFEAGNGQGKVIILGATPGKEYTISVNYQTNSLEGSTYSGNTPPVCSNNFVTKVTAGLFGQSITVAGSEGTLLAKPDCYDDPRNNKGFGAANMVAGDQVEEAVDQLEVAAYPNPAQSQFNFNIQSNKNAFVTVKVTNATGKVVYTSAKVAANSVLRLGEQWGAGVYFVEILQGADRKVLKVIKQ